MCRRTSSGWSRDVATKIARFTEGWAKGGTGKPSSQPLKSREFEFTAYLAKYQGGDWDSTVQIEDGLIWKGSLLEPALRHLQAVQRRSTPIRSPCRWT